jgi:biopolymer transport protein ExbB/TolQ
MDRNLLEVWREMPWVVRAVVIVLTMQAVASIAVVIDRMVMLMRAERRSRAFATEAGPLIDAGRLEDALVVASRSHGSHLALFMHTAIATFVKRLDAGDGRGRAAELARRALERKAETIGNDINRGMGILASTGSTAPFVGLLGTVLGILNAFKKIAEEGSGGIGTIGGSIGEALIVTGYGLMVAIPTVLLFNWLTRKITEYETGLVNGSSEVIDRLETEDYAEDASSPGLDESPDESDDRHHRGALAHA